MHVKILIGEDAFSLIHNRNFIKKWEILALKCINMTVIQEYAFVSSWYFHYYKSFDPVLVLGYTSNDKIIGLIPLALSKSQKFITHAGDHQAEYHGWLCEKEFEEDFLVNSLIKIRNTWDLKSWSWRYTPPGSYHGWIKNERLVKNGIFVTIEEESSPKLDLTDSEKVKKIKKNRSIQTKINRFKKKGTFFLERIKDSDRAKELFEILLNQCDFRQLAINNVTPFRADQNKKEFYLELIKYPQYNHFTVLWFENEPIAFHFGACDHNTVYLGLSGYNPIEERNSPGSILLVKLIELIQTEGYRFLDLTPGRDAYKERYASEHQKVYILKIYFSKLELIIFNLKKNFRKFLIKTSTLLNFNLSNFKENSFFLFNIFEDFKKFYFLDFIKFISSLIFTKEIFYLMKMDLNDFGPNQYCLEDISSVNKYSDILSIKEFIGSYKCRELTLKAFRKFNSEEIFLSNYMEGQEVVIGWLAKASSFIKQNLEFQNLDLTEKSILIYDIFSSKGCESERIIQLVFRGFHEAKNQNAESVSLMISKKNKALVENFFELGFDIHSEVTVKSIFSIRKFSIKKYGDMVNEKK